MKYSMKKNIYIYMKNQAGKYLALSRIYIDPNKDLL